MLQQLKFKTSEQNVFFWGCTHIFHTKDFIWQKRGYGSPEAHAEALKDKINNTCTNKDILFLLGDGFLNSTPERVENFLFRLNPTIAYIWGNHESSMKKLYQKHLEYQYGKLISLSNQEIYPLSYRNIMYCGNYLECYIDKTFVVVQHFPLSIFNGMQHGAYNLVSHSHGSYFKSLPSNNEVKQLDVGVDVFPDSPISFGEVKKIMSQKVIPSLDHH